MIMKSLEWSTKSPLNAALWLVGFPILCCTGVALVVLLIDVINHARKP